MSEQVSSIARRAKAAAFAVAAAASLALSSNAHADSPFTMDECKVIAGTTTNVVRALGKETLSQEFRDSFLRFLAPEGKLTCTGPMTIVVPTTNDHAALLTIRSELLAGNISLESAGLRTVVNPADVAALSRVSAPVAVPR